MTEEEKRMVMQFMGQTYGSLKQNDDMLVNPSSNLRPKHMEMQNAVKELARVPTSPSRQQQQQQAPPQQAPPAAPEEVAHAPAPQGAVSYEQAVQELAATEIPSPAPIETQALPEVDSNQLEFNLSEPSKIDQLLEASKTTNLILKEIKVLLENKNVKPTRKKTTSKKPG